MNAEIKHLQTLFSTPGNSVLTLHKRPDGDSIGSNLALKGLLEEKGHTVSVFSIDEVPKSFHFLEGAAGIQVENPKNIPWGSYQQYFALDMSDAKMLGEDITIPKGVETFVIDHHDSNKWWGDHNIITADSLSASSVLFEAAKELSLPLKPNVATALLTGVATDSGFFKFAKTTEPFTHAAELIELGADYEAITDNLLSQMHFEDLEFIRESLSDMSLDVENRVAFLPITEHTWKTYGITPNKNIYLTEYIAKISGTDFGALLIEEEKGMIKISLRAHTKGVDVAQIAEKLGGGGHKEAAGATLRNLTLQEAMQAIRDIL